MTGARCGSPPPRTVKPLEGDGVRPDLLDRRLAPLAGPDPDDLLEVEDEDLPVADLARPRGGQDGRSTTSTSIAAWTAASILTLGMKSTTYSAPR